MIYVIYEQDSLDYSNKERPIKVAHKIYMNNDKVALIEDADKDSNLIPKFSMEAYKSVLKLADQYFNEGNTFSKIYGKKDSKDPEGRWLLGPLLIIAIQKFLKDKKLYKGDVDGFYGPKTKEAVRVFQKQSKLSIEDGRAGKDTILAMLKDSLLNEIDSPNDSKDVDSRVSDEEHKDNEYIEQGDEEFWLSTYQSDLFKGKPTASGELYDPIKYTCAHKTHPFGTMLKVSRLDNLKSVIVKVNDRGPFISGRVVEVSKIAAKDIDLISDGSARVKVEVVKKNDNNKGVSKSPFGQ